MIGPRCHQTVHRTDTPQTWTRRTSGRSSEEFGKIYEAHRAERPLSLACTKVRFALGPVTRMSLDWFASVSIIKSGWCTGCFNAMYKCQYEMCIGYCSFIGRTMKVKYWFRIGSVANTKRILLDRKRYFGGFYASLFEVGVGFTHLKLTYLILFFTLVRTISLSC